MMDKKAQAFALAVSLTAFFWEASPARAQYLPTACGSASPAETTAQNTSTTAGADGDYIRVNGVGYLSCDIKIAIAFSNTALTGQTFSVINNSGGTTLYGPEPLVATSAYAPFTYLYDENFSAYQPASAVTCYIEDSDGTKSVTFVVGPSTYQNAVTTTVNFYRGQNCGTGNQYAGTSPGGTPTQADCHMAPGTAGWTTDEDGMVADGPNKGLTLNVEGGIHDSGDWIKFMITMAWVNEGLLFAYQENPTVFTDQLGADLQAGANGVPDVLDEGAYILNWIIEMNPNATTFYYDVADGRDHDNFGNLPECDTISYDTTGATEGTGDYPAVANPYRAVYGGTQATASIGTTGDTGGSENCFRAAGALAMGYQIWNASGTTYQNTTFAATCLQHAEWLYALGQAINYSQTDVDDFYTPSGDFSPEEEMAAVQLYKATGTASYLTTAESLASAGSGELDWYDNHFMANLCLYRVDPSAAVSTDLYNDIEADYTTYSAAGNPYGVCYPYGWGGMEDQTSAVFKAQEWAKLFPTSASTAGFVSMGTANRDWLLGRNPWGCCFIQGLGEVYSLHPQHNVAMAIYPTIIAGGAIEGPVDYADYTAQISATKPNDIYAPFDNFATGGWVYSDNANDYASNEITSTQSVWNVNVIANLAAQAQTCVVTPTYTPTPTVTSSPTKTNSPTNTLTLTGTATPTDSMTPSATASRTPTPSSTPTGTPSLTATPSATPTSTYTPASTSTATPTPTATRTSTATPSATSTSTATPTDSMTATPTHTNTATSTPTATDSMTPTASPTASNTGTATNTPLFSYTPTDSFTVTNSPTSTATRTATATDSMTPTASLTASPSATPTEMNTATSTNTPLFSSTPTGTPTATSSSTATNSSTATPSFSTTPTHTPTVTPANSATPTATSSMTPTASPTASFTPNPTNTPTPVPTGTATATWTVTPTNTAIATATATSTPPVLVISTGAGSPGNSTVASGSANVPDLQFTLTNNSASPATLTSITVPVTGGPGATQVTLETTGGTVLGTGTVSGGTATLALSQPLVVGADSTATYLVVLSFSTSASGTYSVTLQPGDLAASSASGAASFSGSATGATVTVAAPTATPSLTPTVTRTPSSTATPSAAGTPVLYPDPVTGPGPVYLKVPLTAPAQVQVTVLTTAFRKVNFLTETVAPGSPVKVPLTDEWGNPLADGLYYVVVEAQGKKWVLKLLVVR